MTDWTTVPLGEAIELAYGKSLPKALRSDDGKIPVYGSNGITGWHSAALTQEPVVIIGRKGSAGAVQFVDQPCFPIDTTYFVQPRPRFAFDTKFLYYLLLRLDLSRLRTATGVPGLTREDAYRELIAFPGIHEQRRISDLLTRAEGIVRLRREAAAKAAELIPAIFIDMFGDPLTNPKQLSIRKVEDVVAKFEGGKNIQAGDGEASNLRILKVSAVTSGTYVESECKPAPNDYVPPTQHFVRVGDMLFSRANTSELVGATALVEHTNGSTLLPDKLWRFVWKAEVDPFYMWALFQSKAVRQQLSKLASGTSDSMRNISQAKLFALDLPIAKLEDQRRFGELINSARSVQAQQQTAMMQAQATFNALVAQAFAPHGGL